MVANRCNNAVVSDAELQALRDELERLVAAGLRAASDHADALASLEAVHAEELVALGVVHQARIESIDAANLADSAHLRRALATRDLIGQAKRVLMVTLGCDADKAFAVLLTRQHENRKILDLAAEITARVVRPPR